MTLSELLEELNGIDPETWGAVVRGIPLKPFCQYFTFDRCGQRAHQYPDAYLPFSQMERDVALAWLQGCLQQACEGREWDLKQFQRVIKCDGPNEHHYYAEINKGIAGTFEPIGYEGWGDSTAEALLAAYVAAVKGEKQ